MIKGGAESWAEDASLTINWAVGSSFMGQRVEPWERKDGIHMFDVCSICLIIFPVAVGV